MEVYQVQSLNHNKIYYVASDEITLSYNDKIVYETDKGIFLGEILKKTNNINSDIFKYIRIATDEDIEKNMNNIISSRQVLKTAQDESNKLNLNMFFIDAYFSLDKKQLMLTYTADNRVDFRELAKNLAAIYKTRIELRQIGIRDKAKEISGLGQCGRKICCSSFLRDIDSVSISMVKNQNLALNPTKINGTCGRLLCCLTFEDNQYKENRKLLPKIGDELIGKDGFKGKVTTIDILNLSYILTNDEGESKNYVVSSNEK